MFMMACKEMHSSQIPDSDLPILFLLSSTSQIFSASRSTTSTMPAEDSAPGFTQTLCMVFQHGSLSSLTNIRLHPEVPVDVMTNIFLSDYHGVSNTAPRRITHQVSEVATPEEVVNLGSQPVDVQQETMMGREPMSPLQPAPRNHNNLFTSTVASSEGTGQPIPDEERGSDNALTIRSKITGTRVALLVVGALSLVVVPGLVLGVVTKQIPWGIALSGAIATVASFFAGLYYYHNK